MSQNIGIVGLGMIADFHARAVQATKGAELVACCSRSAEKADAFGGKFGCAGYSDLQQFLGHDGLDAVSICGPSGAHMEPALAAIAAGKHLIVEKPLEVTRERCRRIVDAAQQRGVVLAGIFPSRFLEVSQLMKRAIEGGRIGRPVLGDAYVKWFRSQEYYDEGGWKGTQKYDGGGALMNQSIHAIDLLQWFMGPVDTVMAASATLGHTGIEVEDTAVAALKFTNGALGTIEGSTAVYPGFHKRVEVYGTTGSMVSVQDRLETWTFAEESAADERIRAEHGEVIASGGGASNPADIGIDGHKAQFEDLVQAIEQGRPPAIDGPESVKAVDIILSIYESARTGKPVTVG